MIRIGRWPTLHSATNVRTDTFHTFNISISLDLKAPFEAVNREILWPRQSLKSEPDKFMSHLIAVNIISVQNAVGWLNWLEAEPYSCSRTTEWVFLNWIECIRAYKRLGRQWLIGGICDISVKFGYRSEVSYTQQRWAPYCCTTPNHVHRKQKIFEDFPCSNTVVFEVLIEYCGIVLLVTERLGVNFWGHIVQSGQNKHRIWVLCGGYACFVHVHRTTAFLYAVLRDR